MFEVRERDVPEQLVLTERRNVRVRDLPDFIGSALERLIGSAEGHGGVAAAPFIVYHGKVDDEHDGPVEVCVPIAGADAEATGPPMRNEPAHREAYARLRKEQVVFPEILGAYDAVVEWADAQGLAVVGAPREVYFTDFMAASPRDEVCDVAFPVTQVGPRPR
jgi:effector-binding domain-containing protein